MIDIRKLIVITILTFSYKEKRNIISWEDLMKYLDLLEYKFKSKLELGYTEDINEDFYNQYIKTYVDKENVYFALSPDISCYDIHKSLVDENLILEHRDLVKLFDNSYDEGKLNNAYDNIKYQFKTLYFKENSYQSVFNKRDEQLHIDFYTFVKIFRNEYFKLITDSVNSLEFFATFYSIINFLYQENIVIDNINFKNQNFDNNIDISEYIKKIEDLPISKSDEYLIRSVIKFYLIKDLLKPEEKLLKKDIK